MTKRGESVRFFSFLVFGVLVFGLLIYRLAQLQVVQGPEFRERSEENRIRFVELLAPRGVMRDRHGKLLVSNRPSYTCYGIPRDLYGDSLATTRVGLALAVDPHEIREVILKPVRNTYRPQRLRRDLPYTLLARFEELRDQIPGAYLEIEPKRFYPYGVAPHLIGYVAEIAEEELAKFPGLQTGDLVGKRGLERLYDKELRGVKGSKLSVVDVHGQEVESGGELGRVEPVAGSELWTTLDLDVQMLAESLLTDKIGSVVALDVRTGGVVVMASSPSYIPDVFAGSISSSDWRALLSDSTKPMLNRSVQTMYPPGSTIKPAMLVEGLESGAISPSWGVSCPGSFTYGNRTFKCWKKGGHGYVDCTQSLAQSCDVFYYKLGLQLGVDGINRAMSRFHFGSPTGVDQTSEAAGLIPSEAYYNKRYGPNGWSKGFVVSVSIGQGEMLATPVQLAAFAGAVATGVWRQPHIVDGVYDPGSRMLSRRADFIVDTLDLSSEILDYARHGMTEVVWGAAGTARRQQNDSLRIAGKTGTAQNAHGDDHGWFICYGPVDNPMYSCCALIEFGKSGSGAGAPVAGEVLRDLIRRELFPDLYREKAPEEEKNAEQEDVAHAGDFR
ncbi:MAG: penicillin-binding protein 2 [Calditrichaeota bacterium]|nr:penicillin-binding protein 2 [Calditrichota bacterium]MCB9391623.1 penicillin-binding protein 2 [Calditrichota bacterium]